MGMLKEFRDFALKGNVVDLAVAVIIGGAFGAIISLFLAPQSGEELREKIKDEVKRRTGDQEANNPSGIIE